MLIINIINTYWSVGRPVSAVVVDSGHVGNGVGRGDDAVHDAVAGRSASADTTCGQFLKIET
jgi:hypothetical protein